MAEVVFNLEGTNTTIQCNIDEKMKEIINRFLIKINNNKNNNNLFYLYNGTRINKELSFNEQANKLDKNRKKINVINNINNSEEPKINKEI